MNTIHIAMTLIPAGTICYLLTVCASDALEDLSGGRVRKLEEKNRELAEKLDLWLEEHGLLRTFLRFLLFIFTAATGAASALLLSELAARHAWKMSGGWFLFGGGLAAVLITLAGDLISRSLLPRCDIFILKTTMPGLLFLAKILLAPMKGVYRSIEQSLEKWKEKNQEAGDSGGVEYEILDMMEDDEPEGQIEEDEKRMIKGIFELSDTSVKEIMTPRVDVEAISFSATLDEAKKIFVETGHSRIPVYGRSIDEIKGIVYAKDFLAVPPETKTLEKLMHRPIFIPETKAVDELLDEIKRTHNHFAVIIDEYGGTSGIVTFEDIIEEIIGDVLDEYDSVEDGAEKPQLLPDGSVMIEARTPVSDVNEILGIDIPDTEHADTIGGYLCTELGRIPDEGEVFTKKGLFSACVEKADRRKIIKLKMTVLDDDENE